MQSLTIIETAIVRANRLPMRLLAMDDEAAGKLAKALSRFMIGEEVAPESSGAPEVFKQYAEDMEKRYQEYMNRQKEHYREKIQNLKERINND